MGLREVERPVVWHAKKKKKKNIDTLLSGAVDLSMLTISCGPGFESQAQFLGFLQYIFNVMLKGRK